MLLLFHLQLCYCFCPLTTSCYCLTRPPLVIEVTRSPLLIDLHPIHYIVGLPDTDPDAVTQFCICIRATVQTSIAPNSQAIWSTEKCNP